MPVDPTRFAALLAPLPLLAPTAPAALANGFVADRYLYAALVGAALAAAFGFAALQRTRPEHAGGGQYRYACSMRCGVRIPYTRLIPGAVMRATYRASAPVSCRC